MEMQQVRYFIAVARTLNFTRAAEESNVTQPALTRAIKLLEYELGGELIHREGRNTRLTDLGQKMLPILRQCHDAALAAKVLARAVAKGEVATLRVGIARALDTSPVMGPLEELYPAFPGLQIKLKRGNACEIVELLKAGDIDIGVGGPLGEIWDRLETWPIFSETFELLVGAAHPLAMRNAVDLDEEAITDEQFLVLNGLDLTDYERQCLSTAGVDIGSAHEVDSIRDMEALVIAGFGVGVAPSHCLRGESVRHLRLAGLDLQRTIAAYTVAGRQRSPASAALLNLLRGKHWN